MIYFRPSEFGEWWALMDQDLLSKLDDFRQAWGYPVLISPVAGALGRHNGPDGNSMHNVDKWEKVRAVDVFPQVPDGKGKFRAMRRDDDRMRAYDIAKAVGFTGIGIYADTMPGNMVHLDNRDGTHVATWSRVAGQYKAISEVLMS